MQKIVPYRGFGNHQQVVLRGHAFSRFKIKDPQPYHQSFFNLLNTWRRFTLRPQKNVEILIKIRGIECFVRTDERGYFEFLAEIETPNIGWYPYQVGFKDEYKLYKGEYRVMDDHSLAVISDIDDTLLHSRATITWLKLKHLVFKNAYSRRPVNEIGKILHLLKELNENLLPEDFIYLSNSEWNLYDLLNDFLELNQLPKGVLLLNDLRSFWRELVWQKDKDKRKQHKKRSIENIMRMFPQKKFVLAGDTGQQDMMVYRSVCQENPHLIKSVIIRRILGKVTNEDVENLENFKKCLNSLRIQVHEI